MYRAGLALAQGDLPGTMQQARRALTLSSDDELSRAGAAGLLGLALWGAGDLEAGYTSYAECMAGLWRTGHIADTLGCAIALADIEEAVESAHTGILTTLRRDGMPIALPVWFVVDDRSVALMTPAGTKKIARIRHDPRASFLVESGERWAELRGVHLTGRARVVDDLELRERVLDALHNKYSAYRTPRAAMPEASHRHYEVETTVIEIARKIVPRFRARRRGGGGVSVEVSIRVTTRDRHRATSARFLPPLPPSRRNE